MSSFVLLAPPSPKTKKNTTTRKIRPSEKVKYSCNDILCKQKQLAQNVTKGGIKKHLSKYHKKETFESITKPKKQNTIQFPIKRIEPENGFNNDTTLKCKKRGLKNYPKKCRRI